MSVPHLDIELSGDAYGRRFAFVCNLPLSGVTVITGPSGAGKSTLLRCLAGLSRLPGRIRVGGETWQEGRLFTPPHEREVGFVFQDTRLWPHMTVRETLNYAVRRARRAVRLGEAETIGLLGLAPLLDRAHRGTHLLTRRGFACLAPHIAFQDQRIWGATAVILSELIAILEELCV